MISVVAGLQVKRNWAQTYWLTRAAIGQDYRVVRRAVNETPGNSCDLFLPVGSDIVLVCRASYAAQFELLSRSLSAAAGSQRKKPGASTKTLRMDRGFDGKAWTTSLFWSRQKKKAGGNVLIQSIPFSSSLMMFHYLAWTVATAARAR